MTDEAGGEEPAPRLGNIDFQNVYERFHTEIYRFFLHRTHDREVAEDLTAATFELFWERPEESRSLAHDRGFFALHSECRVIIGGPWLGSVNSSNGFPVWQRHAA